MFEERFERVFEEHGGYVLSVLCRFGVAERDLADVAQEVFLIVHRKLPEFEGRASLRTWLYRICVRAASDYRRRAHRRHERIGLAGETPVGESQSAELIRKGAAETLQRALDRLGDDCRRVFVLYEIEQRSMKEIAALLECPLQTAFSRLYSARRDVNAALRRAGWTACCFGPVEQAPRLLSCTTLAATGTTAGLAAAAAAVMLVAPPAHGAALTATAAPNPAPPRLVHITTTPRSVPAVTTVVRATSPPPAAVVNTPPPEEADPLRPLSVHYEPAWQTRLTAGSLDSGKPTGHARSTRKLPPPLVKPRIVWPSVERPDRGAKRVRACALLEREARVLRRLIRNTPRRDPRRAGYLHRLTMLYAELDDRLEAVIRSYDDPIAACDRRKHMAAR